MRLVIALAAALQAAPLAAQGQPSVTLREAIARAARHDPAVVQARGGLRTAGHGVLAARGSFLPSLTASSSGGSSFSEGPQRIDPATGQVISGDTRTQDIGFTLNSSVDLFTGFRRGADVRAARGREDAAEASLDEATARSALQTSTAFFNALANRELLRVRQEGVRRAEQQLAIASARLRTRAATVGDSLRAEVQLVDARIELINQEARLAAAEADLARRLGLPGRVAAADGPDLEVPGEPFDRDATLAEALARAPAVRRAEAGARAADASLSAARSTYWPTLSLSGSYSYAGSDRNDFTLFNSRRVSLGLTWPLFTRFQREQQVAARAADRDTERARVEDERRAVAAALTGQLANLEAAERRLELTGQAVQAARADVAVALERYQLGSITIVELNASQDGLTRAEQNAVNARFDYLRARAEIQAILGRTL
jgi:outer membrane protein